MGRDLMGTIAAVITMYYAGYLDIGRDGLLTVVEKLILYDGKSYQDALQRFWLEDCWDKDKQYDSCTACPWYQGHSCAHPKRPRKEA